MLILAEQLDRMPGERYQRKYRSRVVSMCRARRCPEIVVGYKLEVLYIARVQFLERADAETG